MKEVKASKSARANLGLMNKIQSDVPEGWRSCYRRLPIYLLDIDEGEDFSDEHDSDDDEFDGFVRSKSCLIN